MYIDYEDFESWLSEVGCIEQGVSPGWLAKKRRVTRQTVHNWINSSVIDAYRYQGREGAFVILDLEDSLKRIERYKSS